MQGPARQRQLSLYRYWLIDLFVRKPGLFDPAHHKIQLANVFSDLIRWHFVDADALVGRLNEVLAVAEDGDNGYAEAAQKAHQLLEGAGIVSCSAGNNGQSPIVSLDLRQQQQFRDEFGGITDVDG